MTATRPRSSGPRAATIGDVADRAGVSVSSVSRYIHGERVRSAEGIAAAITELGFRPSHAAQSLKRGRTMTIAVVVPDVSNPFFSALVRGADGVTAAQGYTVLLANTDESRERERVVLDGLAGRVDGILLAPATEDDENPAMLRRLGIPFVHVDRSTQPGRGADDVDVVLVDNVGGARAAVEHLVAHGHRRIAVIGGHPDSTPGRERLAGALAVLAEHGIPVAPALVEDGGFREAGGRAAMRRLLALPQGERPTAVFATNNQMTLGALEALAEAGIAIPAELSLVGFDDHPYANLLAVPLSIVDRPDEEQGRLAMGLLLDRLAGRADAAPRRIVLPARLVERASCGRPPAEP